MTIIAICSFVIWIYLFFLHGRFWGRGPILHSFSQSTLETMPEKWPDIYVVIPARDEAETIECVTNSLLHQDYVGDYKVLVVDDASVDHTGDIVKNYKQNLPASFQNRLDVIETTERPEGWSGKLWALSTGVDYIKKKYTTENAFFFFTDADIEHEPSHLTTLACKALKDQLDQVSEMVKLRCKNLYEKALIPAFVYFFCMLYPFSKVNKKSSPVAAGAGGTVLLRSRMLTKIGGVAALKNALIDDVTLAFLVKRNGGNIYLGHSSLARSLRPYDKLSDIWNMITRTAYVQLRYSFAMLLVTVILMSLMWFVPFIQILIAHGTAQKFAIVTYVISICSFIPTLSRFNLSFLWMIALPIVALFYLLATIGSALNYYLGKGMMWKGRAYVTPAIGGDKKELQIELENMVSSEDNNQTIEQKDNS
ncbi:glycosyltransferase [Commensalibacter papalotli (ex Botero et al. 2024)]|uniref:Catalytic subunit of cellulose synthase and poly-beta-1 n=1 Tax=Commensalibacter papalotli (ex Botero et al. 2024) TaxID=2972766 RepID=A0ABM9HQP5_9PROT|nr:glycosyltransferase [Commensalibacter papalotli (ex Botero et al. 2024)]CAI3944466.1 6-N-acetylglucosamine synthase (BcsA) (PDB:4HG6) [Commensalibacter papalotli (ex Botero et al. 2024)]CAI3946432.1 6-N-acetylglucosamine synthase (BcsA) (PDB:4HG6) [Commensalibacter papalotli (ex Botero et al. 2024)]